MEINKQWFCGTNLIHLPTRIINKSTWNRLSTSNVPYVWTNVTRTRTRIWEPLVQSSELFKLDLRYSLRVSIWTGNSSLAQDRDWTIIMINKVWSIWEINRQHLLKIDFRSKIIFLDIHLYFTATKYLWNNALVEYIDN